MICELKAACSRPIVKQGARHVIPQRKGRPFPSHPFLQKVAVHEKEPGCFSWTEAKSSDRGKILIPQKIKQYGFQSGLVEGLFPSYERPHINHGSLRGLFQAGDTKQNFHCPSTTVRGLQRARRNVPNSSAGPAPRAPRPPLLACSLRLAKQSPRLLKAWRKGDNRNE